MHKNMKLVQLSIGIKRIMWGWIWEIKDHCPKKMCFMDGVVERT
jgi:hypothetical protein